MFQIGEVEDYLADVIQHLELEEKFSVKNKNKSKFWMIDWNMGKEY